jgi:hypothetical protein
MRASVRTLLLGAGIALASSAAEATVLRVITVETSDAAAYVKEVERGNALLKQGGSPVQMRVWRGRYAGEAAGRIVVQMEYSDLAALAKDEDKFSKDPEMQAWLKAVGRLRKVVSDSVYEELR